MYAALVMATGLGKVWHDTWRIAVSVAILFALLAWWNWLMKNLGTF
jgi:hypothetical protein